MPMAYASSSRGMQMEMSDDDEMFEEVENGGNDEDGFEAWTVDSFKSRPMTGDPAANMVKTMYTKMMEPISKIDESLIQFGQVAAAIADCDEHHEALDQVQSHFLKALSTKYELQIRIEVLKGLEHRIRSGEEMNNVEEVYTEESTSKIQEWSRMSDRAKFKYDRQFEVYRAAIWEKHTPAGPAPPVTRYLARGEDDEDGSDDEIETGATVMNYKCPLTGQTLVNAHTSQKCHHSYSGQYIMEQLEKAAKRRKLVKCPFAGCSAQLRKDDVVPDPQLQKRADEHVKREKRLARETARNHEDDDDEVVSNE